MSLISYARRTGLIAAAALAATMALAVPASAAGAIPAAQAQQLQARADYYLATMGGVQVAPDQIDLDGATVHLLAPNSPAYTCAYKHFCAYRYQNFVGGLPDDVIDMYYCQNYYMPWGGRGSWINNQTRGTSAVFKDGDGVVGAATPGAYSQDGDIGWSWIVYVKPC
ncbi:hypothetical protein [Kutzneria sp. NPDC052558]|uniref:hypothetical protein n=1 Tax=Kutzneria sp. NPDC052558 TaxID=3364121 RepID=UPI0037CABC04